MTGLCAVCGWNAPLPGTNQCRACVDDETDRAIRRLERERERVMCSQLLSADKRVVRVAELDRQLAFERGRR